MSDRAARLAPFLPTHVPRGSVLVFPPYTVWAAGALDREREKAKRDGGLDDGHAAMVDAFQEARRWLIEVSSPANRTDCGGQPDGGGFIGLMTTKQVAAAKGCDPSWVQRLARKGRLPARRMGRFYLFDPTDPPVRAFLDGGSPHG